MAAPKDDGDRHLAGTLHPDPASGTVRMLPERLPRLHDAIVAGVKGALKGLPPNPLRTGFTELDAGLVRLGAKEITMLAADSGVGKSTLSTQIALHAGATGHGVVYLNLEMSLEMYGLRTIANYIKVPMKGAMKGDFEHARMLNGVKALQMAATSIVLGSASEHRTLPAIRKLVAESAKQLADEGTPVSLIVVDHVLQLLVNVRNDKDAEGKARADFLKELADTFGVHVMALVHVTREASKGGNMPTKNQLASSEWFNRHADNIGIFHQKRDANGSFAGTTATLGCQKVRWGEPFAVQLEYEMGLFYPWILGGRE